MKTDPVFPFKGTNPMCKGSTPLIELLPRVQSLQTITMEIRVQACVWEKDINIQITAESKKSDDFCFILP